MSSSPPGKRRRSNNHDTSVKLVDKFLEEFVPSGADEEARAELVDLLIKRAKPLRIVKDVELGVQGHFSCRSSWTQLSDRFRNVKILVKEFTKPPTEVWYLNEDDDDRCPESLYEMKFSLKHPDYLPEYSESIWLDPPAEKKAYLHLVQDHITEATRNFRLISNRKIQPTLEYWTDCHDCHASFELENHHHYEIAELLVSPEIMNRIQKNLETISKTMTVEYNDLIVSNYRYIITKAFFQEMDIDEGTIMELMDEHSVFVLVVMLCKLRRQTAPKVYGFVENVVQSYTAGDFKSDFRLNRSTYDILLERLRERLTLSVRPEGKPPLPPNKQLLVFLWYLSNQDSMREIARLFGISKSTVHGCIRRVSMAVSELSNDLIKWPTQGEQDQIASEIEDQTGIPNCIGFIDGTHIRLANILAGDNDYINRKKYPSVQLQLIVDNHLQIRDVYVGWPGCTHDARVYRNSPIADAMENNRNGMLGRDKFIIGDSAYPLAKYLMTPFRDNGRITAAQRCYNRKVSSARQAVERSIGHLKGRFRRLRNVDCSSITNICYLITAGCVLHNLCIISNDDITDYLEVQAEDNEHPNAFPPVLANAIDGVQVRTHLVDHLLHLQQYT